MRLQPTQPLRAAVQQVCAQLPQPVDVSACQLLLNKKALDLGLPARLANLPAGAKLELRTGVPCLPPRTSLWNFCSPRLGTSVCSWRHAVICILVSNCCTVRPGQERQLGFQSQTAAAPAAPQAQPGLSPGVLPGPLQPEAHAAAGNGQHAGRAASQPDGQPRGPLQDARPGSIGVASSTAAPEAASAAESAKPHGGPSRAGTAGPASSNGQQVHAAEPPAGPSAAREPPGSDERDGGAAPDPLGLGRAVHVFAREAAEASEAAERCAHAPSLHCESTAQAGMRQQRAARSAAEGPPPGDDFYDFTAEDWAAVAGARARAAAAAEGAALRTAALRERDERAAASRLGPVPVRVHLPDGLVLQARPRPSGPYASVLLQAHVHAPAAPGTRAGRIRHTPSTSASRAVDFRMGKGGQRTWCPWRLQASFSALEPLGALRELVGRCLVPGAQGWCLYTTPPKQVACPLLSCFHRS